MWYITYENIYQKAFIMSDVNFEVNKFSKQIEAECLTIG